MQKAINILYVVLVFYYSLLVCTIIWACVLLYCVTDLHVLQQTALVMINIQRKDTLQNTDTL